MTLWTFSLTLSQRKKGYKSAIEPLYACAKLRLDEKTFAFSRILFTDIIFAFTFREINARRPQILKRNKRPRFWAQGDAGSSAFSIDGILLQLFPKIIWFFYVLKCIKHEKHQAEKLPELNLRLFLLSNKLSWTLNTSQQKTSPFQSCHKTCVKVLRWKTIIWNFLVQAIFLWNL